MIRTTASVKASLLATLVATILGLVAAGPAAAAYEQVSSWDADYPQPIALDGAGNLVVGSNSPGNAHVTIYSPGGLRIVAWDSPEGFNTITGIAVDAQSRVYVTDLDGVQIFTESGQRLDGGAFEVNGKTVAPFAIDIDARGDLYVTHFGPAGVGPGVFRFSAAFQTLAEWGEAGSGPGQFAGPPLGVASDGRGGVFVSDRDSNRVQRFSDAGAFVAQWGQPGTAPGQFDDPAGVAVDSAGNVFVADEGNGRVQVFDPNGRFLDQMTITNTAGSSDPRDVAVAADGTVYVTEDALFGRKIYVFRPVASPAPPSSPTPAPPATTPPPPSKPGGGNGAENVTISSKSLRYRKGKILVAVECSSTGPCRGNVRLLIGKTALGSRAYNVKPAATTSVAVKLTARGRKALSRAKGKKITVILATAAGKTVTKKLAVKAR